MAGNEPNSAPRGKMSRTGIAASQVMFKGFNINSAGEKLPLVPGLVKKISKGGKGEWNEYIPMAPNDPGGTHVKEITNIVNFILSIPPKK